MKTAIFPGSFDPITNGHIKTIERASKLFDKIYFVVLTNTTKKYLFDVTERVELAAESLKFLPNVEVISRTASLTVDVAHELHADFILRGLRNEQDFGYERAIAAINKTQDEKLETVFFLADPEESYISSSMIKEVAIFDGKLEQLVPVEVATALKEKLRKSADESTTKQ